MIRNTSIRDTTSPHTLAKIVIDSSRNDPTPRGRETFRPQTPVRRLRLAHHAARAHRPCGRQRYRQIHATQDPLRDRDARLWLSQLYQGHVDRLSATRWTASLRAHRV